MPEFGDTVAGRKMKTPMGEDFARTGIRRRLRKPFWHINSTMRRRKAVKGYLYICASPRHTRQLLLLVTVGAWWWVPDAVVHDYLRSLRRVVHGDLPNQITVLEECVFLISESWTGFFGFPQDFSGCTQLDLRNAFSIALIFIETFRESWEVPNQYKLYRVIETGSYG